MELGEWSWYPHGNALKARKRVSYKHHRLVELSMLIKQEIAGKLQEGTEATNAISKR